jgi:DNA polymerase-1
MADLLAIDGSNFANRGFHVLPRQLLGETPEQAAARRLADLPQQIGKMLAGVFRRWSCTHVLWVQDAPGPTWHSERIAAFNAAGPATAYPEYHAARAGREGPGTGEMLAALRPHLAAWGIPTVEAAGFSADDALATVTARALAAGHRIFVLTRDKDLLQVIAPGAWVIWPTMDADQAPEVLADDAWVRAKFGIWPYQVPDWIALVGDSSDGLPRVAAPKPTRAGVKMYGFDAKKPRAAELLAQHFDLDGIYAALDRGEIPAKEAEWLTYSRDQAALTRELATLRTDVPVHGAAAARGRTTFARAA